MPIEKHGRVDEDAPPVSILSQISRGIKKDDTSKYLSVYLGLAVIVVFLATVSLVPQVSQKLGSLQAKKQTQQSQAADQTIKLVSSSYNTPVQIGQQFTLSYSAPTYTACDLKTYPLDTASAWYGKKANQGSVQVSIKTDTYFQAICAGPIGQIGANQLLVKIAQPTLPPPPPAKKSMCPPLGDVNGDGWISKADSSLILNIVAGLPLQTNPPLPFDYLSRAKVDGKVDVSSTDALIIQQFLASTDPNYKFTGCTPLRYPQ